MFSTMGSRMESLRFAGALIAALAVFAMSGCAQGPAAAPPAGPQPGAAGPAGTSASSASAAAIQDFLGSASKHGTLTFSNVYDGVREDQKVEYWFKGPRYRLTWFNQDGSIRLHMMSADGTKVYNCRPEKSACELSYTLAEFHQWIFNGPPDWKLGEGVKEGDLTKYTYTAKKLWTIEGSTQSFYLEDLVVYADDTRIVKTVTRTTSQVPKTEADLVTSTYEFDPPEIGVAVTDETLTLPYPIKAAE